jgi:protein-S-isoprenylcysteine O-methyltransferase Ste14
VTRVLARWRVALGFAAAALALVLARPTWFSWQLGLAVALLGECLRVWAAGHIEKGREITRSGPYRFLRHPLYAGSALLGIGFAIAARSPVVAAVTAAYLGLTLFAAMRSEEAHLDAKFGGAYSDWRSGRVSAVERRFSLARAISNREYEAIAGVLAVFLWLAYRVGS